MINNLRAVMHQHLRTFNKGFLGHQHTFYICMLTDHDLGQLGIFICQISTLGTVARIV